MSQPADAPILELEGVSKHFVSRRGLWQRKQVVQAVNEVSLKLAAGETLGLVGESGCGKSTLGRLALRLTTPTAGRIRFDGQDLTRLSARRLRPMRRHLQAVFQNPYTSLNPRLTAGEAIGEALRIHRLVGNRRQERERVVALLQSVGLQAEHAERRPQSFSGGQRQRISIARALASEPRCIIADEPLSALDVSVQAQVVNLLLDLQRQHGLAYLFIAHDLRIVAHISDRVAVMYLGRIVEIGPTAALFPLAKHPYTQALHAATPSLQPSAKAPPTLGQAAAIADVEIADAAQLPSGCAFHPRCPLAQPGLCNVQVPPLRQLGPAHQVACHLA